MSLLVPIVVTTFLLLLIGFIFMVYNSFRIRRLRKKYDEKEDKSRRGNNPLFADGDGYKDRGNPKDKYGSFGAGEFEGRALLPTTAFSSVATDSNKPRSVKRHKGSLGRLLRRRR